MARRYSIVGDQNAATTISILGLTSAATIRPALYTIIMGSAAAPADQANNMQLKRYTAAGTATSFTPHAHDPANPAALASGAYNHTVEPTYTAGAQLMSFSLNQQNTFKWETLPEYGLIAPATAANGLGLQFVVATGTALHEATFMFEE